MLSAGVACRRGVGRGLFGLGLDLRFFLRRGVDGAGVEASLEGDGARSLGCARTPEDEGTAWRKPRWGVQTSNCVSNKRRTFDESQFSLRSVLRLLS